VTAQHTKFDDTTLDATAGRVGVVLNNLDLFWHTFTIRDLGVNLNVPVQAERRIEFDAPAGTYAFVCKIPGHEQAGMEGTLTVSRTST
jgi:plastocyanin